MTSQQDHKIIRRALRWESYPARGVRYTIRPDVPFPEPGDEQEGPSDPTPAGDPQEAVRLLREYLQLREKLEYGAGDDDQEDVIAATLPAPLPESQRTRVESRLGMTLPADLRALYAVADGDGEAGLFQRLSWWVDLDGLAKVHGGERHWAMRGSHDVPHLTFRYDSQPPGMVRRAADRPGWAPFVLGTGGDYLAVDLDPGPNGRPGQVIRIGSDRDDGAVYITDSVTSLLRKLVTALTDGDYERVGDDELYIEVEPDWRDSEEDRHWSIGGADASLDGLPPTLQHLTVTDVDEIDLEPLRGAPILRWVQLSGRTTADLDPLRDTPVEILDLDLKTIDLAPLTSHPQLRSVALRSTSPVDLAPLRSCPHLYALDLSNTHIEAFETVAALDGLRYLALRHRQWQQLWECTDRLPPLAVAFLAGKASRAWQPSGRPESARAPPARARRPRPLSMSPSVSGYGSTRWKPEGAAG